MNKYRVAELRKKRGWTQEVLAEKANITVRTVQRVLLQSLKIKYKVYNPSCS